MCKNWMLVLILLVIVSTGALAAQIDLSNARIVVLNPQRKIMTNAADMLLDEIEKRTRIDLEVVTKMASKSEAAIVIGTVRELAKKSYKPAAGFEVPQKADAYAVWIDTSKRKSATICAAGYDDRGTLFAVGRLLRILDMSRDKVSVDSDIKISTAPKYTLRGHQQAYRPKTNSYDGWTIDMWEQYYREMAVFGMNAVELLPPRTDDADDSPHFPKPKMEMMVLMSQLADDYGLDVWIWFPARDKYYTDKKTVDAAIEEWGEVFRKLPRLDAVFVPGGDPGKTHPAILLPFMEKQKKNLNKYHPKAQMWVSPQGFDRSQDRKGWLKIFLDILQKDQPAWLDGVVFGPQLRISLPKLREAVPAMYPIRRYPDITHSGGGQYKLKDWDKAFHKTLGRETITYRPYGYARIFRDPQRYALGEKWRGLTPVFPRPDEDTNVFIDPKEYSMGFITYSEGCNDDFNKVLWSCLGWDPEMKVEDIVKEYSRFFISKRYEESFSKGIFALEKNWVGPVKDNDGIYETLKLFQEMEKNATPQDKLNWRFQQGLYRAYYDAYIKARLHYETELEAQAFKVLKKAKEIGAVNAVNQAKAILNKAVRQKVRPEWRARTFELAEALYQSIRMQLSVEKYQAISINRGANLDSLDVPLNSSEVLKIHFDTIREMRSEDQRLKAIKLIVKLAMLYEES